MEAKDALGNQIITGNFYGYSHSSNGHTKVTIGKADKISNGKVTIKNCKESTFLYISEGQQKPYSVLHPERARTVASVICFPVIL